MKKSTYEKPSIFPHVAELANKFGRGSTRNTLTRIDNVAVTDLIDQFGSPLFVFSEQRLRQRFQEAHRVFSTRYPKVKFAWSYKTNYLDAVCRIFHHLGAHAEVVSEMEYEMARRLGVPADKIFFNGPYKPESALRQAFQDGAHVHIDHYDELYLAENIAGELGRELEVSIRVNMDAGTHTRWDRFGFNYENGEAMNAVRRINAGGKLVLAGLHSHIGTFILDSAAYGRATTKLAAMAREISRESGRPVKYLDLGGGFASRATLHEQYGTGQDCSPSLEEYADSITRAILEAGFSNEELPALVLESGRSLVDDAGFMLTRVIGNKRLVDGTRAVVVDAGVNVLFTSFWYRHDVKVVKDRGGLQENAVLYGPLCMNIDVVRPSVLLPPVEIGDPLVISPVGAYNVTQWLQFIRLRPPVVLIGPEGQCDVIRKAETVDTVKGPERLPDRLNGSAAPRLHTIGKARVGQL